MRTLRGRLAHALAFRGRATRLEFWRFQVFSGLMMGVVLLVGTLLVSAVGPAAGVVFLPAPVLFVAGAAVLVRRLHDRNKSGWWALAYVAIPGVVSEWDQTVFPGSPLYPVAALLSLASLLLVIWSLVEVGFLAGTPGRNRYGEHPRAPSADAFT